MGQCGNTRQCLQSVHHRVRHAYRK